MCKARKMSPTPYGTVTHTLSGCADPIMRSQHIHRHNGAVQLVHKVLRKGYSGSKLILSDGGKDPTDETRPTKTMPEWLLSRDTHPIPYFAH
jgi:hypothetical protein